MILTAANQALDKAKEISTAEMAKITSAFKLPGLGGM
jgi:DNA-binding protein YbaB